MIAPATPLAIETPAELVEVPDELLALVVQLLFDAVEGEQEATPGKTPDTVDETGRG